MSSRNSCPARPLIILSYGHLGRAILLRHFQNLLKWGFLPTLTVNHGSSSSIFPLSTNDFICHVLVPEAAILLIMEDKGHTTEQVANSPERVAARAEACRARKKSVECGRWRFRADGDEAEAILNKLERQESKTRRLYQRLRGPASPTVLKVEERATRSQPVVVSEETTESGITGYKSKKSTRKHHRITTPETGTKPP